MSFNVRYGEVVKNNKTYVEISTCKVNGAPEDLRIKIDNLFNGDKEAGDRANRLLNENWRVLYEDISGDYLEIPCSLFVNVMGGFFSRVSLEEMFD